MCASLGVVGLGALVANQRQLNGFEHLFAGRGREIEHSRVVIVSFQKR